MLCVDSNYLARSERPLCVTVHSGSGNGSVELQVSAGVEWVVLLVDAANRLYMVDEDDPTALQLYCACRGRFIRRVSRTAMLLLIRQRCIAALNCDPCYSSADVAAFQHYVLCSSKLRHEDAYQRVRRVAERLHHAGIVPEPFAAAPAAVRGEPPGAAPAGAVPGDEFATLTGQTDASCNPHLSLLMCFARSAASQREMANTLVEMQFSRHAAAEATKRESVLERAIMWAANEYSKVFPGRM